MPSQVEHGARVRRGLAFIATMEATPPSASEFKEQLAIEYFYTCLHMVEAAFFGHEIPNQQDPHFYSHGQRRVYFQGIRFDASNPFSLIGRSYEALRELSERARYLGVAGSMTYDPLDDDAVEDARALHEQIRLAIENLYSQKIRGRKRDCPWRY